MNDQFMILGTAGHIDHGKTTLVKALTGIATDVHKEEKERGITIDIGFAPFTLPDGRRVGVIDVPGHERFVRNMLAGAGGIDLIMLVIDANEGIMPQTLEHLHILEMLHVQQGIIVLTKIDTVDPEWLEMVQEEVREGLAGTFLADAPIVPVSAAKGIGIAELRGEIGRLAAEVSPREVTAPLRLPVDRVFSVAGFGTVVTGTVYSGRVKVGDTVEVLPQGIAARVRHIQVHGESADAAQAGQRAALNLHGVERSDLERGMVIAQSGLYRATELLDVRLHMLDDAVRTLTNRMRVRFYIGASEVMGRVTILDRDELLPGEDGLVQLHLESPIVGAPGDRFIIRTFSPMLTIGGGTIIDPHPAREHRRRRDYVLEELEQREKGGPEQLVLQALQDDPGTGLRALADAVNATEEVVESWLAPLLEAGQVTPVPGGYVGTDWLHKLFDEIEEKIRAHFAKEKYHITVPKAQVLSQLGKKVKPKLFDAMLSSEPAQTRFLLQRDKLSIRGYEVPFTLRDKELLGKIEALFAQSEFHPPSLDEVIKETQAFEKTLQGLYHYLRETGVLVDIGDGAHFLAATLGRAKETIRAKFAASGSFGVADFRDWVGTSRKHAVALLEYLDAVKFTKRVEDKRVVVE
ncbi:selenocysteine-specific translation elongation factor SelB [Tumebacillus sp. BK434]|uniref:selenocysteine-specific translation elongation factor n=1 Tax=Tumebacillus sp. BK434 TaxID=2512169 RepID=UPI0010436294|nr:selenocysteine-specific translation elongation factor [Tumebacillus sp. BK434]TCP55857.1 selenocysteine-specific translation elongation factor SelB [Tumebacillus sp. BK434]